MRLWFLAVALTGCTPWWAEPPADAEELADQLDAMVEAHTGRFGYEPAIALAIVEEGLEVVRVEQGTETPDGEAPVTGGTRMPLASATKVHTALVVMKLVEEGALSLDDAAGDLVPDLPGEVASITVGELLTHSDGLADGFLHPDFPSTEADRLALTAEEYVALAADLEPAFEPGTDSRYGQTGFVALSIVVASVAGAPYEDHLQDALLDPVGMASTGFAAAGAPFQGTPSQIYERVADGFTSIQLAYVAPDVATAALMSTLDDQVALMGALQRGEVVSPDTLADITGDNGWSEEWGLGWERTRRRGFDLSGHSGGQSVVFEVTPDGRAGSVFLSNSADPRLLALGYEVAAKAAQWADR